MEFRILGSIEAFRDRRPVNLGGVQTRRLLGLLLAYSGEVVGPDRIVDALWWSVDPPTSPERTVQSYVSRLRGSLGDGWVTRKEGGYLIETGRSDFDARLFAEAVKSSRGRPPAEKLATLATALDKWRGVPFGEFSDEPWAVGPVRRLRDLRATALESIFAARISLDGHREVVGDLEAAVAEYPEHTDLVGHLMVALARSGSHAAALRTFHLHRRLLADESGLDPSPRLVDLERQILANDVSVSMGDDIPKIRGYELIEPIGHGLNGTVYRARQPVTDRPVAVKVIRPEIANEAEVARQFEPRAQRIARFEHTNVNTLYDFWREAGGAYLVSRLLTGGDVAQSRLSHGPWTPERTTRLVHEVGGALAAGHRAGLVHGNIRDGNVLFDDAGNSYLSDYPVVPSSPLGAPPGTISSDCLDFILLVWSVLAGRKALAHERPLLGASLKDLRPDIPDAVPVLFDRIAKETHDPRSLDLDRFVKEWNTAVEAVGHHSFDGQKWKGENPYKGLRPFDESDAADFFGRDQLAEAIAERVESDRFVAVVGASGSGKSSLLRAGVVPLLRATGWSVATMRPGEHPVEALVTAFAMTTTETDALPASTGSAHLRGVTPDVGLLLVIDQLEELFTLCADRAERAEFIRLLTVSETASGMPIRIVASLRVDFLGQPLQDAILGPLLRDGTVIVPSMTARELDECVRGPAERHGIKLESALVTQIVTDVMARAGSLPLLQFALADLFDRRDSACLSLQAYDAVGGIAGALSRRAEAMYTGLPQSQQTQLPQLISRLVVAVDGRPVTSRRAPISDFPDDVRGLIDTLVADRLASISYDPATREPMVELAHESLFTEWPRIEAWLATAREDVRMLRQIGLAAMQWEQGGRDSTDLYRGNRLHGAVEWSHGGPNPLSSSEQRFLDESRKLEGRETEQRERSLRLVKRLSAGLAVLLVAAIVGAAMAVDQRQTATRRSYDSETKRLLATSAKLAREDPPVAMLLAVEGSRRRGDPLDGHDAILQVLNASPSSLGSASVGHPVRRLVSDRTGRRVIGIGDSEIVVVDVRTHRVLTRRSMKTAPGLAPWIANGPRNTVVVTDGAFDVRLLDDLSLIDASPLIQLTAGFRSFAVSPDGNRLAIGDDFGAVHLWDLKRQTRSTDLHLPTRALSLAFSNEGRLLATGERSAVAVWDTGNARQVQRNTLDGVLHSLVFGVDSRSVIVSSEPVAGVGTVAAFDVATGAELWRNSKPAALPANLAREGPDLMFASDDRGVRRLNLVTGDSEFLATTPTRSAVTLADGSSFVTAGDRPAISFWSTNGDELLATVVPQPPGPCRLQTSADGRFIACTDPLKIWDLSRSGQPVVLSANDSSGFLFGPSRVLILNTAGGWRVSDLRNGTTIERGNSNRLSGGGNAGLLSVVRLSPDGRLIATADRTHLLLVDFRHNTSTELLVPGPDWLDTLKTVHDTWFSADAGLLSAQLDNGDVYQWSTDNLKSRPTVRFAGAKYGRRPLAFDATDRVALTDSVTGESAIMITDRQTGAALSGPFVGLRTSVSSAVFDPTGAWIATTEIDGIVRLWDVAGGRSIGAPLHNDPDLAPIFLPGEELRLVTTESSRTVVWKLGREGLVGAACHAAGRNLTRSEWLELGPKGEPFRATCDW